MIPTRPDPRQILVLQGGGALGSYQAGVYEGLCARALEPDGVAGISIGAINAAINSAGEMPRTLLDAPEIAVLRPFAQENPVTVVQQIYQGRSYETGSKDYEFSRTIILEHWTSGLEDAKRTLRDRQTILRAKRGGGAIIDSRTEPRTPAERTSE